MPATVPAVTALWNTFVDVLKGVPVQQELSALIAQQIQELPSEAIPFFEHLREEGCHRQVLAFVISLAKNHVRFAEWWKSTVRPHTKPYARSKVLKKAADELEDFSARVARAFAVGDVWARDDGKGEATELTDEEIEHWRGALEQMLAECGRVPPRRLIFDLRYYAAMIDLINGLSIETETRSLGDFSKYVLCAYVERATGKANNEVVAALISKIFPSSLGYSLPAHEMWRNRHYRRLKTHFSVVPEFLAAMGQLFSSAG